MLTLKESMELGGDCQIEWLNPDFNHMITGGWEAAHDAGRWWDAMLRLEDATGYVIPADMEGAMLRNLKTLTDNPDGLLMVSREVAEAFSAKTPAVESSVPSDEGMVPFPAGKVTASINMHNLREGMLAFNALVRYRNNQWARTAGRKLLQTIDKIFGDDGKLDITKLECRPDMPEPTAGSVASWEDGLATCGRALAAIVWFYEATGDALALNVADRIARYHLTHSVNADGSMRREIIDESNVGHCHSYLGTLRGLLLFGLLTKQHEYIEVVAATYRNGLPSGAITESGWTSHDLGKHRFLDQTGNRLAESASCGDVVQLGLWLALEAGYTEFLDDVERWVRSRLLPAQFTEADRLTLIKGIMQNHNVSEKDAEASVLYRRSIGGWGCSSYPYGGKGCILDVLSAVVHSLVDVYNNITTRTETGLIINLHFDYEDNTICIKGERGEQARLTVRPKVRDNILIRIPGWVKKESVILKINGKKSIPKFIGNFVHISKKDLRDGSEIIIEHALPKRETIEVTEKGSSYKFAWRGDEIIGIFPNESPLPFYKSL